MKEVNVASAKFVNLADAIRQKKAINSRLTLPEIKELISSSSANTYKISDDMYGTAVIKSKTPTYLYSDPTKLNYITLQIEFDRDLYLVKNTGSTYFAPRRRLRYDGVFDCLRGTINEYKDGNPINILTTLITPSRTLITTGITMEEMYDQIQIGDNINIMPEYIKNDLNFSWADWHPNLGTDLTATKMLAYYDEQFRKEKVNRPSYDGFIAEYDYDSINYFGDITSFFDDPETGTNLYDDTMIPCSIVRALAYSSDAEILNDRKIEVYFLSNYGDSKTFDGRIVKVQKNSAIFENTDFAFIDIILKGNNDGTAFGNTLGYKLI